MNAQPCKIAPVASMPMVCCNCGHAGQFPATKEGWPVYYVCPRCGTRHL